MRVFVTGGTGFVGPAVVRELLANGHQATVLVHRSRGPFRGDEPGLAFVEGDVTRPETLRGAMQGHDALAHLVAVRRGSAERFERMHTQATRNVVEAAQEAGVRRLLLMSAEGVDRMRTPYERTKVAMEHAVKGSGLQWTIFRPTFITGPAEADAGGFDHEFASLAERMPVMPSFDGGTFKLQPVAKGDVARAFALALEHPASVGKTYALAGPEVLTWDAYLRALGEATGKRLWVMPAPTWALKPLAGLMGDRAPADPDELDMLVRDHVADTTPAQRDLGLTFQAWRPALREALARRPEPPARQRRAGVRARHA